MYTDFFVNVSKLLMSLGVFFVLFFFTEARYHPPFGCLKYECYVCLQLNSLSRKCPIELTNPFTKRLLFTWAENVQKNKTYL